MKKVNELKQGDEIYDINFRKLRRFKYLCVHPTGRGKYHILIDECEEPVRMYEDKLQTILDQDFKTRQEAKLALADRMEEDVKSLRSESNH